MNGPESVSAIQAEWRLALQKLATEREAEKQAMRARMAAEWAAGEEVRAEAERATQAKDARSMSEPEFRQAFARRFNVRLG